MNWIKYNNERLNLEDFTSYLPLDNTIVFKALDDGELVASHTWEFDSAGERDKILEQIDRKCEARKLDVNATVGFK